FFPVFYNYTSLSSHTTLSLHDALPILSKEPHCLLELLWEYQSGDLMADIKLVISNHETTRDIVEGMGIPFYYIPANKDIRKEVEDRKSTRLNSSHVSISYAVFCLKKKK